MANETVSAMHEATCPECGEVFRRATEQGARGAVQLHRSKRHRAEDRRGAGCDHEWRLLRASRDSRSVEERAMRLGAAMVCTKCDDLATAGGDPIEREHGRSGG